MAKGVDVDNSEIVTLPPVVKKRGRFFKIIVLGDMGVGKTCLTLRFCGEKFQKEFKSTIGFDFRDKIVEVDGETVKVRHAASRIQPRDVGESCLNLSLRLSRTRALA